MATPSPQKPPLKLVSWKGEDTVFAGALLDCGLSVGSAKAKNPQELVPFEAFARVENRHVKDALKNPKMLKLAVNLYQLHGPLFAFKQTQLVKALGLVAKAVKAVSRERDVQAWAANETLKTQAFCTGLRSLFRKLQVPTSLKEELCLDDAGLQSDANKVNEAQFTDGDSQDIARACVCQVRGPRVLLLLLLLLLMCTCDVE